MYLHKKIFLISLCIVCIGIIGFFIWRKTTSSKFDAKTLKISQIVKNEGFLTNVLQQIGIKEAMIKLRDESSGGSDFDCHQEAHEIGRIGYKIYREKAFQMCDASCHSGCYHGAMETFLSENGTADLNKSIERICNSFDTHFGRFECLHGVGHGVLAYLDYDLPEAISECEKLDGSFAQSSCFGGMFMENILTGQGLGAGKRDHGTSWVNREDPYFPCNKIKDSPDLQYQCYQMQTSWMLTIFAYDFALVAKACLAVPQDYISVCFKSFGRDAAGQTLRNPEGIVKLCNSVPRTKDYYEQCVIGAVNVIVDFWGPDLKNQATALCRALPEQGKKACYEIVAGRLPDLFQSSEEAREICYNFEEAYRYLCK